MKYKMVVSDFDDTLLKDDCTISNHTLETIKKFQGNGGKFVLCTGRMFKSITSEAKRFGLNGIVSAFQGALIGDIQTGTHYEEYPIPKELAIRKLEYLENKGVYIQIYDENDNLFSSAYNKYSEIYKKWCSVPIQPQAVPLSQFVREGNFKVFKILVADEAETIKKLYDEIRITDIDTVVYTISKPILLELVYKDASKGASVRRLAQQFGVQLSEVIAIGDSLNDVPMLEVAGLSVAVENAMDIVKERVDYITASNNDDGVAAVIEKFCLQA